jgi:hypothetical protein
MYPFTRTLSKQEINEKINHDKLQKIIEHYLEHHPNDAYYLYESVLDPQKFTKCNCDVW